MRGPVRRAMVGAVGLSAILILLAPAAARAAALLAEATVSHTGGAVYMGFGYNAPFSIYSDGFGDSLGGFTGGVGAKISGDISLSVRGRAEVYWLPKYDFSYRSQRNIGIFLPADPHVGDSFFIAGSATPLGLQKLHIADTGMSGGLRLEEQLHLYTEAKGCLGGCAWAWFKINGNLYQNLVSVNSGGTGDLRVLGQTVGTVPYTYTTSDGVVEVSANLPKFATTISSVAPGGKIQYKSRQSLASASVDVAQLVANIIGVPFPLSGSVVGFDYTLLEVLAGMAVDLRHQFEMKITGLPTAFKFSAPVEYNAGSGWSSPTTLVVVPDGALVEVRPVQGATNLGVVPWYGIQTHVDAGMDAIPYVFASVRALELSGYGLDFGPLLSDGTKGDLGAFSVMTDSLNREDWTLGKPINLTFDPIVADADGVPLEDLCLSEACLSTAFLPLTSGLGGGWARDSIVRIADMSDPACLLGDIGLCVVDETFGPIRTDYRPDPLTGGIEFAPDMDDLLRILTLADLVGGPESSTELAMDSLSLLGVNLDDLLLARTIGHGTPWGAPIADQVFGYEASVPGPGALALVTSALAGLGAWRLRPRRRGPRPLARSR